jgi:6-phosphogluconolactonase
LLPLSILLLGMGADMHCASLFPGSAALEAALAPNAPPVLAIHDAGDEVRVTLTGPVLRGAMSTHVLILGKEKREAVERAARMTPQEAPIALVLRDATVHWAASL